MEPKIEIIDPRRGGKIHYKNSLSYKMVERISKLLDSQFEIPGTKIRFGLDPIIGLFPVIGDFITYLISAGMIYTMHTHGASRKVVIKMIINSTVDAVFGSIPFLGPVFDVFYRSNDRNMRLLQEHYVEGKHQGSGNGILIVVVVVALLVVGLAFYGAVKLFEWILTL